jgi:cobalt/nickel transport system ATP-binding protein
MTDIAVRTDGLRYAYHDGKVALEGIHLRIEEGEKVGIVGPNGAGKSTLLLCLDGILRGEGTVEIFGETDPKAIRKSLGLVFQDPEDQLFMPTVFEDVAFGPLQMGLEDEDVRERVSRALDQVGMQGFEEKSPHHLSYGEKRSVAIATVLSMDPRLLVMDEPSSNLDPRSRRRLLGILGALPQTQIIASHDLPLVLSLCSRCVVLDDGRVVADGESPAILGDGDLMERHGLEVARIDTSRDRR